MNREEKTAVVDALVSNFEESEAIFAVDYRGITVSQVEALRAELREADATLQVVKNTLTELAADKAGQESIKELLNGPTALTFVRGDAAKAAKALKKYSDELELLPFKGGTMGSDPLSVDEISAIAKLPSQEVLMGRFVGLIASPLNGVVRTLNGFVSGLASQLGQIQEQGLVGGDAEPASSEDAPADESEEAKADSAEASEEEATEAKADDGAEAKAEESEPAEESVDADESAEASEDDSSEGDAEEEDKAEETEEDSADSDEEKESDSE